MPSKTSWSFISVECCQGVKCSPYIIHSFWKKLTPCSASFITLKISTRFSIPRCGQEFTWTRERTCVPFIKPFYVALTLFTFVYQPLMRSTLTHSTIPRFSKKRRTRICTGKWARVIIQFSFIFLTRFFQTLENYFVLYFFSLEDSEPSEMIIHGNYSGWYIGRDYDTEMKLKYFIEDIGLNTFYFYFRQDSPFWLKSDEFDFDKTIRGEEYLYGHKQILARYNLERIANGLERIEDFDWNNEFYPGYYPTMTYHNGLPFPQRPHWSKIPHYKYIYSRVIIHQLIGKFQGFSKLIKKIKKLSSTRKIAKKIARH